MKWLELILFRSSGPVEHPIDFRNAQWTAPPLPIGNPPHGTFVSGKQENEGQTIKRHLLTELTVAISFIVLSCSLAVWPCLEGMLLAKMEQAFPEAYNRAPEPPKPVPGDEEVRSIKGTISEPVRLIVWAGSAVLNLRQKAMTWGGYAMMLRFLELSLAKLLFKRMTALRMKMMKIGNYLKSTFPSEQSVGLFLGSFVTPVAVWKKSQGVRPMKRLLIVLLCSVIFLLLNVPNVSAQFLEAAVEKLRGIHGHPEYGLLRARLPPSYQTRVENMNPDCGSGKYSYFFPPFPRCFPVSKPVRK